MTKIKEWAARAVDNGTVWPEAICNVADLADCVKAVLAEAKADGWKMVPVEPTDKMSNAGLREGNLHTMRAVHVDQVFYDMIAAAPDVTEEP